MKNYLFLIPVYNDWKSLNLLLQKINDEISKASKKADILVIDDCSTLEIDLRKEKLKNIQDITVISLKKNIGSQSSIAIGLKYIFNKKKDYIITILDSDGEDDPLKILEMINRAEVDKDFVITSNRTNRKENPFFKFLYLIHKIFTFLFSLRWISFGNFSSFCSSNLDTILKNNIVWIAFSSAVITNSKIKRLYAKRKERYFGKSKVNFSSLALHSLRVISVLYKRVFSISLLYVIILFYINSSIQNKLILIIIIFIILFNLSLIMVRVLLKKDSLNSWENMIKDIKKI